MRPSTPNDATERTGAYPEDHMDEGAPSTATSPTPSSRRKGLRGRRAGLRIGAILAVALAAGFVAWVLLERDDSSPAPTTSAPTAGRRGRPSIASVAELKAAAASSRTPFYWAGRRGQTRLELTRAPTGEIFIRYLPPDKRAGDVHPFLTIATYPRRNAFPEVRAASRNKKSRTIQLAGGGIAVYDPDRPMNVHLAYPGQAYQIEVFAPEAGVARQLVSSGVVRPVG
jgi:hypothetical protein